MAVRHVDCPDDLKKRNCQANRLFPCIATRCRGILGAKEYKE